MRMRMCTCMGMLLYARMPSNVHGVHLEMWMGICARACVAWVRALGGLAE